MTSLLTHQPARPNVYIGLVGAVGTDLSDVKDQIRAQIAVYGYKTEEIKVSRVISELMEYNVNKDEFIRINELMNLGDDIRECSENSEGVAAAAVVEIRRRRAQDGMLDDTTVFIIDSLKHPSEVDLLDKIYGRNYYTVSAYLSRHQRKENLIKKIARAQKVPPDRSKHGQQANELIQRDEKGKGKSAQNVQDTFAKADFFVNSTEDVPEQVKRFVNLLFGRPFISPTPDEFGMYVAKASANRSIDLSRQVGAAIFDKRQRVVSTGCNEVPYPGGGIFHYPSDSIGDNRDYTHQIDPNAVQIQEALIDFIGTLRDVGYLDPSAPEDSVAARELLTGSHKEKSADLRIKNLTEFGRIVHAEMAAICEAASAGRSTDGTTMYVTTFPCHGCARHIVASGVCEVVYIEPYPKSLTTSMYSNEIVYAESEGAMDDGSTERVRFRPFHGISPRLYQRVFMHRAGKDAQGTITEWKPLAARPVGSVYSVDRPLIEQAAAEVVAETVEAVKAKRQGSIGSGSCER